MLRVGALGDDAAVELLAGRARSAGPGSEWSDTDRELAVELCRRLDGLPLAIELAAARLRVMSLAEVTSRLDDRFRLLAGRGRTHDRHATLRAMLDWSFGLLDDHEQVLLARLSVFAGGFELDAAESVCGVDPLDPYDMVDLVTSLVDKSLVGVAADGAVTRYTMLETVRAYAADHLAERGETETLIERHADWVAQLATAIWVTAGDEKGQAVDRLLRDADNAGAAHSWAVDTAQPDIALRVAAALARSWLFAGGTVEGLRRCEHALELDGGDANARLLCTLMSSYMARWSAAYELAWERSLDALAQSGGATLVPDFEVWSALAGAAAVHAIAGDPSFETCVARMRELASDDVQRAGADFQEGIYRLRVGDAADAIGLFESASALHPVSPTADHWRVCYLAAAHLEADGEAELPPGLLEQIVESGDRSLLTLAHLLSAGIAAADGRPFGEHLRLAVDTGHDIGLAANVLVEGAAAIALRAAQPRTSALLMGHPNPGHTFCSSVAFRRRVRRALGDAEFDRLLAEGAQLSDDVLIALILGLDDRRHRQFAEHTAKPNLEDEGPPRQR